jgi:hypothetical protein
MMHRNRYALIVSSDLTVRSSAVSALGRLFCCDAAASGREALELLDIRTARKEVVGLVLLDLDALGAEAEQTLIAIRKSEEDLQKTWPHTTRVVALSASEKRIVAAFFKGSEAGHPLPLDEGKLLQQIETLEVNKVYE